MNDWFQRWGRGPVDDDDLLNMLDCEPSKKCLFESVVTVCTCSDECIASGNACALMGV